MSESTPKTVNLSPAKQVYHAAAVDVTPVDAVEELIDNSLDNWARVSDRADSVEINIQCEGGTTRVADDTGGLGEDEIADLFALGATFKDNIEGSIGAYGIGAKKAIVRLGDSAILKSRKRGTDTGIGFRVTEDWLNDDNDWSVSLEEFVDVEPNTTVVETQNSEEIWNDDRIENLRTQLAKTYQRFISNDVPLAGRVTIVLNGEPINPPSEIPWSYPPFDELQPRNYTGFEFSLTDIDADVEMDVTVGLMREASSELAGTDFFCQHRLVTEAERREVGGYGSTGEGRIGNFTSHNNRLKVIVEFRTDGDSASLPWDAQKSTIDPFHPVSRAAYNKLRNIVRPYFKANTGNVPKAFVEPYGEDHEYAANGGEIEVLDYSGRKNIMHKPNAKLPEIKSLRRTAKDHAERGVLHLGGVDEDKTPAYRGHVEMKFGGEPEELETVETIEDNSNGESVDTIADLLDGIRGAGRTKEEALIEAGFQTGQDLEPATIEDLTDIPGIGEELARRLKLASGTLSESEPGQEASDTEDENGGEGQGLDTDTEVDQEDDEPSDPGPEDPGLPEDGPQPGTLPEEGPQTDTSGGSGTPSGGGVTVPMNFEPDERDDYEKVCEQLGVDPEDPDTLGDVLKAKFVGLYVTPVSADD